VGTRTYVSKPNSDRDRLAVGDWVESEYGLGIITNLIFGGVADVKINNKNEYIEEKQLTKIPLSELELVKCRHKLNNLLLKGYFIPAEEVYSNECKTLISRDEFRQMVDFHKARIRNEKREQRERDKILADMLEAERKEKERLEMAQIELNRKKAKLHFDLNCLREIEYLSVFSFANKECINHITGKEVEDGNVRFVKEWASECPPNQEENPTKVSDEQGAAIAEAWQTTQVVARAGSGKTATIVNRAHFLLEHCKVSPGEILLLAFNKQAAKELSDRLAKLCGYAPPHVMTFHALARAIVNPKEELIYNDSREENQGLDGVFHDAIRDRLDEDIFLSRVRELMIAQFKEDWDDLINSGYNLTPEQLYQYQKSQAKETLRGEYVKSHGEKVIANFLFEHDIPYLYEKTHYIQGKVCHPDFTILPQKIHAKGIVLEYFGMAGSDKTYDDQMEEKRQYWSKNNDYVFIELLRSDFRGGEDAFIAVLQSRLEEIGVQCKRLSDEEIWLRIKSRAIKRFSSAMSNFVGRCRKAWILPDDLEGMISRYETELEAEAIFLELAVVLYRDYLDRLAAENKQDFDGLLQEAAEMVKSGKTVFKRWSGTGDLKNIRYIFIDEYQDFTELFHRLTEAIRLHNSTANFFCVGDDWQAINRFAGSDLVYYEHFDSIFPQSRRLYLSTNYRSVKSVVAVGNALMSGHGKPAVAVSSSEGIVRLVDIARFSPTIIESEKFKNGTLTPLILRIAGKALQNNKSVVLLTRTNDLQLPAGGTISNVEYLDMLRRVIPEKWRKKISISTAHKFKGGEGDIVIILDAVAGKYPLIHPNWIFARILGETIEDVNDENRRLFYVALTRAKEQLFIITETDEDKKSPYLADIRKHLFIPHIDWDKYPPCIWSSDDVVVRITGTFFELNEEFKADGFSFRKYKGEPLREKILTKKEFSAQQLHSTPWAQKLSVTPNCSIEIRILDVNDKVLQLFSVDNKGWKECVILEEDGEDIAELVQMTSSSTSNTAEDCFIKKTPWPPVKATNRGPLKEEAPF
jgi:DNA helicase-4